MPKIKEQARWSRLEIYLPDEETRRRVKLAAASRDQKISAYCTEAILERLEQDEEQSASNSQKQVEELRAWQQQVRAKLKGKTIPDTAEIIRQLREERARGIPGLR